MRQVLRLTAYRKLASYQSKSWKSRPAQIKINCNCALRIRISNPYKERHWTQSGRNMNKGYRQRISDWEVVHFTVNLKEPFRQFNHSVFFLWEVYIYLAWSISAKDITTELHNVKREAFYWYRHFFGSACLTHP